MQTTNPKNTDEKANFETEGAMYNLKHDSTNLRPNKIV